MAVSAQAPGAELPRMFIGQVIEVISGDELRLLLPDGRELDIRLAGIEAPGEGQYFFDQSRSWLASQLKMQIVSADCEQSAKSGFSCVVYPDDREINLVSLYHGLSRAQKDTSVLIRSSVYQSAEQQAIRDRAGVWSEAAGN